MFSGLENLSLFIPYLRAGPFFCLQTAPASDIEIAACHPPAVRIDEDMIIAADDIVDWVHLEQLAEKRSF